MNEKINVLHIIERLDIGGAEVLLLTFAKNVDKDKFKVIFCCIDEKGSLFEAIANEGVKIVCLKPTRYIYGCKRIFALMQLIKKENIDIVNTHLHTANYIGRLVAYMMGVKIICKAEHGYTGDYRKQDIINIPKYVKINMFLDRISDAIVYVSEAQLRNSSNKISNEKKIVIYNGLDTERFEFRNDRNSTRKALGLCDEDKVIGIVSNLHKYKGHIYILSSLEKILPFYPLLKLLIVGEGPEKSSLEKYVNDLGIKNNVIFLGGRKDVPELMRAFDILVVPSLFESFGMTLIEGMYSKLPIIGTNVGGIPEILKDGETGILIPPRDSEAIKNALLKLIENPALAKSMGERGREIVLSKFTGQRYAREMERLYISLLEERTEKLKKENQQCQK